MYTCVIVQLSDFVVQEVNEAWEKLKQLALRRQERLFGAHEIQNFFR